MDLVIKAQKFYMENLFLDVAWSGFFLEESQENNTGEQSYPLLLSYHCTTLNSVGYLVREFMP